MIMQRDRLILSIDQSTSGTKAILYDKKGNIVENSYTLHSQIYPKSGWVEHDAEEIYDKVIEAIKDVCDKAGIMNDDIAALAITNQRETIVAWDKYTGRPIYNAVVWQCQRATEICTELQAEGYGDIIKKKTGLPLSPYFSASKLKWMLENIDGAMDKAKYGRLLCGTIDAWLIWKLTDGRVHATDYSNACRTQLFNIQDLSWDRELLDIFGIPESMLPEVKSSDEIFGYTDNIPITGVMGDSHAALFGQRCWQKGMAKATYGTGSSVMLNTGNQPVYSQKGLATSIAWKSTQGLYYVLEGNINCTGATIKWLVEHLGILSSSKESGEIAASLESNGGVYLVPAFVGLGAPYWNSNARAAITGMTMSTGRAHIVRAAEESIAYQIKDILDLMIQDSGISLQELRTDGGPTRDAFLMQFQADILDIDVRPSRIAEISSLGSAFMAGLAIGFWNMNDIAAIADSDKTYKSRMSTQDRERLYAGWKDAVYKTLSKQEQQGEVS
jgi:glycerol kinase